MAAAAAEPFHDLIVIGAGPAGLECALEARARGLDAVVLEAGRVGENIRRWGFVRMFTPWEWNTTARGRAASGCNADLNEFPTGREFVERYLEPLAASDALKDHVVEDARVTAVGRLGATRSQMIGDPRRAALPFLVIYETSEGEERRLQAAQVVDASGVTGQPRWLGDGGVPAAGERALGDRIRYHVEDLSTLDLPTGRYAVAGSGYSAATMLEQFAARDDCRVDWLVHGDAELPLRAIAEDPLPQRHRLAALAERVARGEFPHVTPRRGARVRACEQSAVGVALIDARGDVLGPYRRVYAMVGYRPELSMLSEIQFHQCWATEGPMKMAAHLLGQRGGDCLTLEAEGPDLLKNPEPGFFVLGAKSYGRNGDFLIRRLGDQLAAALGERSRFSGDDSARSNASTSIGFDKS